MIQGADPPYIRFIMLIIIFSIIVYLVKAQLQIQEVSKNWSKYRCKPHIMPFASLYGHDTVENFNYCLTNIFSEQSGQTVGPFVTILSTFGTVLGTLLGTMNNMRLQGATLFGGITQIFSEFSTRMAQLIVKINMSFIRIRQLMFRVQTTMFAIMYMGLSGVNAAVSFGDTALFRFLDFFCFPPNTLIQVYEPDTDTIRIIPIENIYIGQRLANGKQVTSKFEFDVVGQPMVLMGGDGSGGGDGSHGEDRAPFLVSANHYVYYDGTKTFVKAKDHPDSIEAIPYTGKLICLNCEGSRFDLGGYTFLDFDETSNGDEPTMNWIEERLNGRRSIVTKKTYDYTTVLAGSTRVIMKNGRNIPIGEVELGTELKHGKVFGKVQKVVKEICITEFGTQITPANLLWDEASGRWIRAGDKYPIHTLTVPRIFYTLIVHGAIIALESGEHIRDYMEVHSPDSEQFYASAIKSVS